MGKETTDMAPISFAASGATDEGATERTANGHSTPELSRPGPRSPSASSTGPSSFSPSGSSSSSPGQFGPSGSGMRQPPTDSGGSRHALAAPFGPYAWRGESLDRGVGHYTFPAEVIRELDSVARYIALNPLPAVALKPDDFLLVNTRRFAARLNCELTRGCGFVLLDRLPLDNWTQLGVQAAYWLLSSCIARPVAQSHDGKLLYDVRDSGRPAGNGVRPDVTRVGQNFHTDNSYNLCPPECVGLLCVNTAQSGGQSGIVSFGWAYQELSRRYPDLLTRLYEPYWFDRQREHAENDEKVIAHPLFERRKGTLLARLSHRQVVNGQQLAGEPLDTVSATALNALEAILEEPGAARNFMFERGQIQYVNNLALGHRRSEFVDAPPPAPKRHLLRIWLRNAGLPGYHG